MTNFKKMLHCRKYTTLQLQLTQSIISTQKYLKMYLNKVKTPCHYSHFFQWITLLPFPKNISNPVVVTHKIHTLHHSGNHHKHSCKDGHGHTFRKPRWPIFNHKSFPSPGGTSPHWCYLSEWNLIRPALEWYVISSLSGGSPAWTPYLSSQSVAAEVRTLHSSESRIFVGGI